MYIRCSKCGETLRLYGEGIADTCNCPKKPIGVYLENSEVKFFGPKKKVEILDEQREEYSADPIKYFAVEIYQTIKIILIAEAPTWEEAVSNVDEALEQDIIDFSEAQIVSESIGNVAEVDYQSVIESDEEDEDWE